MKQQVPNRRCVVGSGLALLMLLSIACRGERRDEPAAARGRSPAESAKAALVAPQPACAASRLARGDSEGALEHAGVRRSFLVHVPARYDGKTRVPLVIDMHGWGSDAAQQAAISGFREKADSDGFIVAHPQGIDASWNGGKYCCGTARDTGVDDEGFVRKLVAQLEQDACIDHSRVYATGLSNGGAMSFLLACRAADLFAATAPVVMGNGTVPCEPSRPISVFMFRATRDQVVPYGGGKYPSAKADLEQWIELDGCSGEPQKSGVCETYRGCKAGSEVMLCSIDAGHVLYAEAAAQGQAIADLAWPALARHHLP